MSTGYGMLSHVMWQLQNSYGAVLVDSLMAIAITDEGIQHQINQVVERNMYGRFGESPYHEGTHVINGTLNMEPEPQMMGHLLRAAFGRVSTTSAAGIQTHVFDPAVADFDGRAAFTPGTLEVHRDVGSATQYFDMLASNLGLSIANGELIKMSVDFIGAHSRRIAAGTPTFSTQKPFIWDQVSAQWNGVVLEDLRDLSINLNSNLEAMYTLTASKSPHRIKRTAHTQVEISGTVTFAEHSLWDHFLNQSEFPFVVNIAGATGPHNLLIDVPLMRLKTFTPVIAGPGLVEAAFTAQGIFSVTSNNALLVTLVNTQEWYD